MFKSNKPTLIPLPNNQELLTAKSHGKSDIKTNQWLHHMSNHNSSNNH